MNIYNEYITGEIVGFSENLQIYPGTVITVNNMKYSSDQGSSSSGE